MPEIVHIPGGSNNWFGVVSAAECDLASGYNLLSTPGSGIEFGYLRARIASISERQELYAGIRQAKGQVL
jgi:hypothetical protein